MKKADWKSIAELIGIAAIVASLIFVGIQLRQDRQIALADSVGGQASTRVDARLGFNEYAELIVRGNNGDALTDADLFVLRNLAAMEEERVYLQTLRASLVGGNTTTVELRFSSFLFRNPTLLSAWEHHVGDMEATIDSLRTPESLARSREGGIVAFRSRVRANIDRLIELQR